MGLRTPARLSDTFANFPEWLLNYHAAETQVLTPNPRSVVETERRMTARAEGVPAAAAEGVVGAIQRSRWVCYTLARISSKPILAPFPYVSVHV